MKKVMKKLSALGLVVVMALSMVACGNNSGKANSGEEQTDTSRTQLYVFNFAGGYGSDWLVALKERYEELHKDDVYEEGKKGIQIVINSVKTNADSMASQILNNKEEVYFTEYANYYTLLNAGVLGDITEAVTTDISVYVYFSVRFKGATNKSSFRLISLNEHMMNSKSDKTASKIVVTGAYGGSYAVNDKIVLPTAIAADVINPNVTFTMTVKMGNEIVKDANGTTLDKVDPCKEYTIKAEKCGDYQVVYTATDDLSNRTTFLNYMIYVVDEEKPEVKFEKAFKDEVKLGDTICIPDFSISDNYTKDEDLVIVKGVYNPNGMFVYIPQDSNSIVATLEGKYELLIMVTDKAGNTYSKTHTVAVIKD